MQVLNQIENLIRKDFIRVSAFEGTENVRKALMDYRALVVFDEEDKPIGLLTLSDALERPHNLVIDCMRSKKHIPSNLTVHEAIEILREEREEALAVQEAGEMIGVVYKDDLVNYLHRYVNTLKMEISQAENALKKISWIQSHRVRQPVASILGLIQLIDRGPSQEDMKEIISLLRKSIIELDKVISDTVSTADFYGVENSIQGS